MRQHKRTLGAVLQQKNLAGEKVCEGHRKATVFSISGFCSSCRCFCFLFQLISPIVFAASLAAVLFASCLAVVLTCDVASLLRLRFHFSPFFFPSKTLAGLDFSLPATRVNHSLFSLFIFSTLSLSAASCRLLASCSDTHGKTCNLTHISDISCVPHSISTVGIHKYSGLHLVCGALLLTWLMLFQSAHCHFTLTRLVTSFSSHGLKSCDCKRLLETVERHRSVGILWLASRC